MILHEELHTFNRKVFDIRMEGAEFFYCFSKFLRTNQQCEGVVDESHFCHLIKNFIFSY